MSHPGSRRVAAGILGPIPWGIDDHRVACELLDSGIQPPGEPLVANGVRLRGGSVMGTLRELLAVDHRQALEFFVVGLQDVSGEAVDRQELLYNASVLAHYAQVSTASDTEFPTPAALTSVFDSFVLAPPGSIDADLLETAGTHCLLMAGFFEDQMRRRYNVRWYAELGAAFYLKAAAREAAPRKAQLLGTMGRNFEPWRARHARLGRELRDTPFLLDLPSPPRVM